MPDYVPPQNKKDSELTYRMSLLPFGTYANPDGTESLGLATPGMIQEPINALSRLFGTPSNPGTFGQGPDAPGNKEDMTTLLMSMYGGNAMNPMAAIPKGSLASGALREAPQRMYHGTGAADDFSMFRPSESGAFGPGVYLSNDAAHAGSYAGLDDGARVMPLDVSGPFASMDDYLSTLHANGRNPEAAQNALLEQGFTGVTGGIGGSDFSNVTNIFKPGSVRSATTGETLFSDTGKPSLFGSAIAGAEREPIRAYRGALNPENIARDNAASIWGSSSPDVASTYARAPYGDGPTGAVAPVDMHFQNPLVVDAGGNSWMNIPHDGRTFNADSLAFRARTNGHDGLIIQNVLDAANKMKNESVLSPATTYAALKRGTVTSPLTGETLFSDGLPSIWGNALAPYQDEPRNALMDYAQNDQGPGNYLKDRMDQPYQPAPGEDFQYTPITPEISSKLSTFAAPLIEKMMKSNPGMDRYTAGDKVRKSQEFLQYKRTLVKPQPFNPPPSP